MWGQKASLIAGLLEIVLFMLATDDDVELNVLRHPMSSKHQLTNPKSSAVS